MLTTPLDETHYTIHSTVRSRHTRSMRAQSAMTNRHRMKQHVMTDQRRLVRGRPLLITELELRQHLPEFKEKESQGILEIRTRDGVKLDLMTLKPIYGLTAAVMPHPVMDSVANDLEIGQVLPRFPGEKSLTNAQVEQVLQGMASVDGDVVVDPKTCEVKVVPEDVVPASAEAAPEGTPPAPNLDEPGQDIVLDAEDVDMEEEEAEVEHKEAAVAPVTSGQGQSRKNKKNR